MQTVRVAILGVTQPHGQGYIDTLRLVPDVEIVAGYDLDDTARARAAERLGGECPIFNSVESLLGDIEPDAVIVTLPPAVTPAAVIAGAEHGAHLLVEKPSARNATEFLPAVEAVERAQVAFWTGLMRRYSPMALQIRDLITNGLLGSLVSMEIIHQSRNVRLRGPEQWIFQRGQAGGGMLHWLGVHWIDQMLFLNGGEVSEVGAMFDTRFAGIDVEDTVSVTLRFGDRMIGSILCGYVLDGTPDQVALRVYGDKGWIVWQNDAPEFTAYSSDERWRTAPTRSFRFEMAPFAGYGGAMGRAHMEAFLDAVRGNVPIGDGARQALAVLQVLDAATEANRTGCRVRLESMAPI